MIGSSNSSQVLVVGGGIGGLTAALMLAQKGLEVRVIEQAPAFGEVGAGLQIAPNAGRLLDQCGLLEALLQRAVVPRRLLGRNIATGELLTHVDLDDARHRYGAPYFVMHRSDLLEVVLQQCVQHSSVDLRTSCRVMEIRDGSEQDRVIARCENGETFTADVLIGADGLWSMVRSVLVDDTPICSGYVAFRGTEGWHADGADQHDVTFWFGPGCHFVRYPIRRGELLNQVAVFRSEAFGRGEAEWGSAEELDRAFDGACLEVAVGVATMNRSRRWPMHDRMPTQRWTGNRICLIGDAAHPMLQYLAQGACQAIEDSAVLAAALSGFRGQRRISTEALHSSLAMYTTQRVARAAQVQSTARAWGDLWHVEDDQVSQRDQRFRDREIKDYSLIDWLWGGS